MARGKGRKEISRNNLVMYHQLKKKNTSVLTTMFTLRLSIVNNFLNHRLIWKNGLLGFLTLSSMNGYTELLNCSNNYPERGECLFNSILKSSSSLFKRHLEFPLKKKKNRTKHKPGSPGPDSILPSASLLQFLVLTSGFSCLE